MDPNNHFKGNFADDSSTPQVSQTQANATNAMHGQRISFNQKKQLADQQQKRTDMQSLQTNPPYSAGVQSVDHHHAQYPTFQACKNSSNPAEYYHNSNANFKTISNGLKLLYMKVSTKNALHPSITECFCLFLLKKHHISEARLLPMIIDAVQVINTSFKACVFCAMRHPPTYAETGGKILTLISNQSYLYPLEFIKCIKTLQQFADIITGDNIRHVKLLSFSDRIQISTAASKRPCLL